MLGQLWLRLPFGFMPYIKEAYCQKRKEDIMDKSFKIISVVLGYYFMLAFANILSLKVVYYGMQSSIIATLISSIILLTLGLFFRYISLKENDKKTRIKLTTRSLSYVLLLYGMVNLISQLSTSSPHRWNITYNTIINIIFLVLGVIGAIKTQGAIKERINGRWER